MGKKSRAKALRKVAGDLPTMMATTQEVHLVLGSELIDQGQTEYNGQPIRPEILYRQYMPVKMAINHYRRLKRAFNRDGAQGAQQYLNTIDQILKT